MNTRTLMRILWPAFLAALLAEGIVFSILDPTEIRFFNHHLEISREAVYSLGFFVLWGICACASTLTAYLMSDNER